MDTAAHTDRDAHRRQRLSTIVTDARQPLAPYLQALSNDELIARLDRSLAACDVLLQLRTTVSKQLFIADEAVREAEAGGASVSRLDQLREHHNRNMEQTRKACEELNSAIANALMYGEVARERNLL